MKKLLFSPKSLAVSGMIGALYVALTLLSNAFGLALGPFQIRLSEALAVLPFFTPSAIPGLFIGCLGANLLSGAHLLDVIFGSFATLLGAIGTYFFRKKPLLAYCSPVLANGLFIPPILYFVYNLSPGAYLPLAGVFLVGELLSATGLGFLLKKALSPFEHHFL